MYWPRFSGGPTAGRLQRGAVAATARKDHGPSGVPASFGPL